MVAEIVSSIAASPADLVFLAKEGDAIAQDIRTFVAPLAAIIIGVMGIRYLVGDQRSLAGFIGFLLLGIVVYALIMWGNEILNALGGVFRSWVA